MAGSVSLRRPQLRGRRRLAVRVATLQRGLRLLGDVAQTAWPLMTENWSLTPITEQPLVSATIVLVFALYLADSFCIYWLFSRQDRALKLRSVVQARGSSYLLSSFNYELGQGALAWNLASARGQTLLPALAKCVLLAYHDVAVLAILGLIGASRSEIPQSARVAWFCGALVMLLVGIGVVVRILPWSRLNRWVSPKLRLGLETWTWRQSAQLCLLRAGYFGVILLYAAIGLRLSGFNLSLQVLCSVIPLALLADGLPISVSGLGTRETTLLYLLNPDEPTTLVAFSLQWSVGLALGRAIIGLFYWWFLPQEMMGHAALQPGESS
jgi:hypothetical protein